MKFSKKVWELSSSPKFKKEINLSNKVIVTLNRLKTDITLFFGIKEEEEILVSEIFYQTDYNGPYLGVIDGFISLIQGKPVEASDRFPIKELDYYLRDEKSTPAFTAYSQEIYEIISIGEKIKKHVFGTKESLGFSTEYRDEFFELSVSEQFELVEELLSFYFYKKGVGLEQIECLDIDGNEITFKCLSEHASDLSKIIKEQLDKSAVVSFSSF